MLIGGGASQGLRVGDRLTAIRKGKQVRNRQTGFMIDLPGEEIARLQIVSFFGKSETEEGAVCKIISGSLSGAPLDSVSISEVREER